MKYGEIAAVLPPLPSSRTHSQPEVGLIRLRPVECGFRPVSRHSVAGALLLGAAAEHGAAAGAEVAALRGHAGRDAVDVRNILAAQPLRIALAGCALLRRSLRDGGYGHQRDAEQRGD